MELHETIRRCSFDAWRAAFRGKTVRSAVVDMPPEFASFLREEELILDPDRFPDLRSRVESATDELGGAPS